jgi:hypothetical protein
MKKQLSRVGIGMFCYISTVSTPKFTNISIKKNEKIGALGLNFILNMQYLYFRSHRHYSKKGCRWSAYDVKTEKSYIHNERYNRSSLGRCSGNEPKSYFRER